MAATTFKMNRFTSMLSFLIYVLAAAIGILTFAYPFFLNGRQLAQVSAQNQYAPVLTILLMGITLGVLMLEAQGSRMNAKMVASLGVLVAITSVLRFLEVAIPGPGGFSPIFAPIILAGYVFGGRFGFLLGSLTLLVSALMTGGVGLWLPYQMFAAGWVGLTAGWLPKWDRPLPWLIVFGLVWGFLYGGIMNLYTWPFVVGSNPTSWEPGLTWQMGLERYAAFYLATSLWWDLFAAVGNGLLLGVLGVPALRALQRFRDQFQFSFSISG